MKVIIRIRITQVNRFPRATTTPAGSQRGRSAPRWMSIAGPLLFRSCRRSRIAGRSGHGGFMRSQRPARSRGKRLVGAYEVTQFVFSVRRSVRHARTSAPMLRGATFVGRPSMGHLPHRVCWSPPDSAAPDLGSHALHTRQAARATAASQMW